MTESQIVSDKTKAIIAYIINYFQCSGIANKLGKVKLVKILWFADREFMYRYYRQLTDLEYRKMPQGPMPTNIDKILEDMRQEHIIQPYKTSHYGYTQQCFMCLKEPDLNRFNAQEISVLDRVIMELQNKSAKQISNQTHDELWNSIEQGKIMPLESIFLQDIIPATQDDVNG